MQRRRLRHAPPVRPPSGTSTRTKLSIAPESAVSAELVGALVALGADVRATDKDGNSALQQLCCDHLD